MGLLLDAGRTQAELATSAGLSKAQVTNLKGLPPTGGILVLIKFATLEGCSPGELLDAALAWWEKGGREQSLAGDNRSKPMGRVRPSAAREYGAAAALGNGVDSDSDIDNTRTTAKVVPTKRRHALSNKHKQSLKPSKAPPGGHAKARDD